MKIHIASDLHLEFTPAWTYKPPEADVNLIAGDVANGTAGIEALKSFGYKSPVLAVPGNHEFYGENLEDLLKEFEADRDQSVRFLDMKVTLINDVVFLCCTLWTDFAHGGQVTAMQYASMQMSDYRLIGVGKEHARLTPFYTRSLHDEAVDWLSVQLEKYRSYRTVVMTHHAPSPQSISPEFIGSPLNPAFVSDLEWMMLKYEPILWVHGHVHSSHDYMVGKTRVIANPRGYPTDRFGLGLRFENPNFNPNLVVEI
jgi:Icc-related predicted phosphoesterase